MTEKHKVRSLTILWKNKCMNKILKRFSQVGIREYAHTYFEINFLGFFFFFKIPWNKCMIKL